MVDGRGAPQARQQAEARVSVLQQKLEAATGRPFSSGEVDMAVGSVALVPPPPILALPDVTARGRATSTTADVASENKTTSTCLEKGARCGLYHCVVHHCI